MTGNTFGRIFRVTTCGESYSGAFRKDADMPAELRGGLMVIIDGVPPGLAVSSRLIQDELDKRKPGLSPLTTPRKEKDTVYIYSGVMEDDMTTGAPVGLLIPNSDIGEAHVEQHRAKRYLLRPGQAAYSYFQKYGRFADWAGAGRASGRETAARVAAGAVAKAVLDAMGVDVIAYTVESHGIKAAPVSYETAKANYRKNEINCPDLEKAEEMIADLLKVKSAGDSCGGAVEVIVRGMPSGVGDPVFDKLSALIAHGIMSIGGVKGIEIGEGFNNSNLTGSESNDTPYVEENSSGVGFKTNHAGGMYGGISSGDDIRIRVAVKPTPTIMKEQNTIDIKRMDNTTAIFSTKSDPSLCPRIYPVCEAMVRLALVDAIMINEGYRAVTKYINPDWDRI